MTRGQRRAWIALEEQKRRRARRGGAVSVPVLSVSSPVVIAWQWSGQDPAHWNIYAGDDGVNFHLAKTVVGGVRLCNVDNGGQWFYVVGVDGGGAEITGHSNAQRPDSVIDPRNTLVLTSDGHGSLDWVLNYDYGWGVNIYWSADGVTWGDLYDAPDSGMYHADENGKAGYFRVCQRDPVGNDILPFSNVVHSDGL